MGKQGLNIPLWKKYLSYIKDVPIDHRHSEKNGDLTLLLVNGRFQLCTANAIYSFDDLYDNFTAAFKQMNLNAIPGDEVLILGLGLGSVPYILEKVFHKKYKYTAVEIDEEIVRLQEEYTAPRMESDIDIIIGNAQSFVDATTQQFDLICIDIFIDEKIPPSFKTTEFVTRIKELLNPKGIILFNHLGITPSDRKETKTYFDDIFKPIFPNSHLIGVKGNYILFNDKDALL